VCGFVLAPNRAKQLTTRSLISRMDCCNPVRGFYLEKGRANQRGKLAFFQLNYSRSIGTSNIAKSIDCARDQNRRARESQILALTIVFLIHQ
jgi:hypothetical protein